MLGRGADGARAAQRNSIADGHAAADIGSSKPCFTIANIAIRRDRAACDADVSTGEFTLLHLCAAKSASYGSSIFTCRGSDVSAVDGDGLYRSCGTSANACRTAATRCVNRTAVDGDGARDVVDVGVVTKSDIAGSQSTALTASDARSTAVGDIVVVPCSALRIDGAAVDGDIAAALRI